MFWLTPGYPGEPDVWHAGTSPQGLFPSKDEGETWQEVWPRGRLGGKLAAYVTRDAGPDVVVLGP